MSGNHNENKVNSDDLSEFIDSFKQLQNSMLCKSSNSSSEIIPNCDSLKRLTLALSIYQIVRNRNDEEEINSFANNVYPISQFTDDIKHFQCLHANDNQPLHQIKCTLLSSPDFVFNECKFCIQ